MKSGLSLLPHEQGLARLRGGRERMPQEIEERLSFASPTTRTAPAASGDSVHLEPPATGTATTKPMNPSGSRTRSTRGSPVRAASRARATASAPGAGPSLDATDGSRGVADRNGALAVDPPEIREDRADVRDGSLA